LIKNKKRILKIHMVEAEASTFEVIERKATNGI
jgi:hypothetical protein